MCLVRCVWIDMLGYASFVVVSIKLQWFLRQSVDKNITKQPGAYFQPPFLGKTLKLTPQLET
jgi:hypothetical protein